MTYNTRWLDTAKPYGTTNGTDIAAVMLKGAWDDVSGVTVSTDGPTTNIQNKYAFRIENSLSGMTRSTDGDFAEGTIMFRYKAEKLPVVANAQAMLLELRNVYNYPVFSINLMPSGRLRIFKPVAGAGTRQEAVVSTLEVAAGVWNHFEVKFSAGSLVVRVNGKESFTVTGTSDGKSYNGSADVSVPVAALRFGSVTGSDTATFNGYSIWSDIAVLDSTGESATYLGQQGVYYLQTVANGTYTDFSYSAGTSGPPLLNDIPPDGDTTFIYSGTAGNKASYTVETLPTNIVSVQSVQPVVYGRKTDSGPGAIQLGVLSSGTPIDNGDDIPLLTDYGFVGAAFDEDPHTSSAWSPTALPQITVERTV